MPVSQIVTNSIASGQTFTSPVFAGTPTGVGVLTAATARASTSGTSIDFTGIPSWVRRITVMFSGVSTNGSSVVQVQLGAGSITTSGYLGAASNIGAGVATSNFTSGCAVCQAIGASSVLRGACSITNISGNVWVMSGNMAFSDAASTTLFASNITLSGTLDRVRITTVNGTDTFDAGSINILYE